MADSLWPGAHLLNLHINPALFLFAACSFWIGHLWLVAALWLRVRGRRQDRVFNAQILAMAVTLAITDVLLFTLAE